MIADERQLLATLHYQTGLSDMLTALYLDAKARNDFKLFATTADGYFTEISRLNAEIRDYLQAHPVTTDTPQTEPAPMKEEAAA